MNKDLFNLQEMYGSAEVRFPDGSKLVIDNVKVTPLGEAKFELAGHVDVAALDKPAARLYDSIGREISLPKEWLWLSEFLRPFYY